MEEVKGLSTISYNTETFLRNTLERLKQEKKIVLYWYIKHQAEEDEKKDHLHVWWLPSIGKRKIQEWRDYFVQSCGDDLQMLDKPLGCELIVKSDFGNAYLYALHDEQYLMSKGEEREKHYNREDVVFSNPDDFDHLIYTVGLHYQDYLGEARPSAARVFRLFDKGYDVFDVLKHGYVKSTFIYQLQQLRKVWEMSHRKILLDKMTGEVMEELHFSPAVVHCEEPEEDIDGSYAEHLEYKDAETVAEEMREQGINARTL